MKPDEPVQSDGHETPSSQPEPEPKPDTTTLSPLVRPEDGRSLGEGDPGTTPEEGRNAAHIRAQDRGESKQLIEIDRTAHCRRQEDGRTQRPEARNLFQESVDQ